MSELNLFIRMIFVTAHYLTNYLRKSRFNLFLWPKFRKSKGYKKNHGFLCKGGHERNFMYRVPQPCTTYLCSGLCASLVKINILVIKYSLLNILLYKKNCQTIMVLNQFSKNLAKFVILGMKL